MCKFPERRFVAASAHRNKITDLTPLVKVVKRDTEGEQRFAPFLNLYLTGNPFGSAGKSGLAKLKALGCG